MGDLERIRLVTLGASKVGKTAIVKRFLFNTYPDKHKPTIEDLYTQEFDIGSTTLKVDLLDTAGDLQFPAMRKLSITTAHAFLLVYGIDDLASFEQVKNCFEEIREHRSDFQEVPIIIAGNKSELPSIKRDVEFDDVCDWIHESLPKIRGKAMECSAKEGRNVREIFKTFLQLSQLLPPTNPNVEETGGGFFGAGGGLRRRSSAYAGTKGGNRQQQQQQQTATPPSTACSSPRVGGLGMLRGTMSTPSGTSGHFDFEDVGGGSGGSVFSRNKPRSRSLIRRSSKKTKPQMRDASGSASQGDCVIS